jgi:hypothetical protein
MTKVGPPANYGKKKGPAKSKSRVVSKTRTNTNTKQLHLANQQQCAQSWFQNWGPLQRAHVRQKLGAHCKDKTEEEDLMGSLQNMALGGVSPAIFDCQIKLFLGWWDEWSAAGRQKVLVGFSSSDSQLGKCSDEQIASSSLNAIGFDSSASD